MARSRPTYPAYLIEAVDAWHEASRTWLDAASTTQATTQAREAARRRMDEATATITRVTIVTPGKMEIPPFVTEAHAAWRKASSNGAEQAEALRRIREAYDRWGTEIAATAAYLRAQRQASAAT